DPGTDCTIGGMAATRASGTTAVRYGTMRENVLGLTVVLADGQIIRTGTRARKSSAGYDLTRLFVGSEGTLGVIADATVRLHPLPEAVSAAVCAFGTMEGAVETVIATIQLGVPVSRLAECILETKQDNRDASFPIALVGHAGDGNFHLVYVLDPDNPAELDQARRLNDRMVMRALAMGGTCSGEHGVGYGKMKYLDAE